MIKIIPGDDDDEREVLIAHSDLALLDVFNGRPYVIESPGLAEPVYGGGDEPSTTVRKH